MTFRKDEKCGGNSVVECQTENLVVAGSNPTRPTFFNLIYKNMNSVTTKKVVDEVTSTLCIPLYNGKILSKSKVNLKLFVDSLDSNLKKALVEPVLQSIGLTIVVNGSETDVAMLNQDLLSEYYTWRIEKQKNLSKINIDNKKQKIGVAEVL